LTSRGVHTGPPVDRERCHCGSNRTAAPGGRSAGGVRLHPDTRSAAGEAWSLPADHGLRRREDGGDRKAGSAEHPVDSGGLATVRSEARAGGVDVRRRRHLRGFSVGRSARRDVAGRRWRRFAATSRRPGSSPSSATAASRESAPFASGRSAI
jgi:hypothetical protein